MRVVWTAGDGELEGTLHSFITTPDGVVGMVAMEGTIAGYFGSVPFHKLRYKLAPKRKVLEKNG